MPINGTNPATTTLTAFRILELANKEYFLMLSKLLLTGEIAQTSAFSNCKINAVNITPTCRKPYDVIFERVKNVGMARPRGRF